MRIEGFVGLLTDGWSGLVTRVYALQVECMRAPAGLQLGLRGRLPIGGRAASTSLVCPDELVPLFSVTRANAISDDSFPLLSSSTNSST